MNFKNCPVDYFGRDFTFRERVTSDTLELKDYIDNAPDSEQKSVLILAQTISDAIKHNKVAFWNKRILKTAYILQHCPPGQLKEWFADVIEMETGERPKFEIAKPVRSTEKKKTLVE